MSSKDILPSQFKYQGRWVDKKTFRAFVYNGKEQKLANSYEEFIDLVGSGIWYESPDHAEKVLNKTKSKGKSHSKQEESP